MLVTTFISNCTEKIDGKKFGPQEFEASKVDISSIIMPKSTVLINFAHVY